MLIMLTFVACNTNEDEYIISSSESASATVVEEADVEKANESIAEHSTEEDTTSVAGYTKSLTITWSDAGAVVDSIMDGVSVSTETSHVVINCTTEGMHYVLKGQSSDGSIKIYSDYKFKLTLDGLSLQSSNSAAINNQSKKHFYLVLAEGTENTLIDASEYTAADASEDCKACLFSEGQITLSGAGTLNLVGNYKHALATDDYLNIIEGATLNITSAVKDGIHTNDYIIIADGTVNVSGVGADGIESDEGAIEISGGSLSVSTTAEASKCVKAMGDITISGGTQTLISKGAGYWDSTESDYANAACIKTDGTFNMTGGSLTATASGIAGRCIKTGADVNIGGGTLNLSATGNYVQQSGQDYNTAGCIKASGNMSVSGGTTVATTTATGAKAIKVAGTYTQTDGTVNASASGTSLGSSSQSFGPGGSRSSSSSYTSRAKGIKSTGSMSISGGTLSGYSKTHEAVETKGELTITGGEVYGLSDSDDAVNSASHMTISGGFVCGHGIKNDGIDANGNLYIKGGVVYACGSSSPEMAIDANTEGGYKLYVSGGTIMTCGPLESGASLTQACYSTSSWSKSTWYAITVGSDTYAFYTPTSGGTQMVVSGASTPTLKSGVSVSGGTSHFGGKLYANGSVSGGTSVSLSSYSSSSSGPGGR